MYHLLCLVSLLFRIKLYTNVGDKCQTSRLTNTHHGSMFQQERIEQLVKIECTTPKMAK